MKIYDFRFKNGITLISLIITIIVLLLLAGVSLSVLVGENGIINKATDSKVKTEQASEKEYIGMAYTAGLSVSKTTGNVISKYDIQADLDNTMGEDKASVSRCGEGFDILIKDKNYYYNLDKMGNITGPLDVIEIRYPGDITKNGEFDGSKAKPYQITCIEDLVAFSNMTRGIGYKYVGKTLTQITSSNNFKDKYVVIVNNLNFNSIFSYDDWECNDFGDINGNDTDGNKIITEMTTGTGFLPINGFSGSIDGNNNEISNIYIDTIENGGLFSLCIGAEISNIGVTGIIKADDCAGGIVARSDGVRLINVYNKTNITARKYAGGLVGSGGCGGCDEVYIINSYNYGSVYSEEYSAGGILGQSDDGGKIYNCYNTGNIQTSTVGGWGKYSGGIVGFEGQRSY